MQPTSESKLIPVTPWLHVVGKESDDGKGGGNRSHARKLCGTRVSGIGFPGDVGPPCVAGPMPVHAKVRCREQLHVSGEPTRLQGFNRGTEQSFFPGVGLCVSRSFRKMSGYILGEMQLSERPADKVAATRYEARGRGGRGGMIPLSEGVIGDDFASR